MKATSCYALIAAAGLIAGSASARAADLGGNCCADLEERVAELEATTARKGNRRVSLTVSGHVNEAVMFWDDGGESNVYVVSNNDSRTRFRFVGEAKIDADWSAGYLLEIGVRYANSGNRTQFTDFAGGDRNQIDIRHSAWWLESKHWGRLWVGQTSTATDGITEINLANSIVGSDPSSWNGGFFLRRKLDGGLAAGRGAFGNPAVTWNNITPSHAGSWNAGEGDRNNVVRYVSPTWQGFVWSASWGEDDMWDVALRYAGEHGGFRVAAGIGYRDIRDNFGKNGGDGPECADLDRTVEFSVVDCRSLGMSASIMHIASGLYVSGSYGFLEDDNRRKLFQRDFSDTFRSIDDRDEHWYIQAGIEKKFFAPGKTTIYAEYGRYKAGAGITTLGQVLDVTALSPQGIFCGEDDEDDVTCDVLLKSRVNMWGFGVVQSIDAAAMDLYLQFRKFDVDATVTSFEAEEDVVNRKASLHDFYAVKAGGIIRF